MNTQHLDLSALRERYSDFASQILFDLGMNDLQQPLRGKLLSSIDQFLNQTLTYTVVRNISPQTAKKISELIEKDKSSEEVIAYLVSMTPDMESKIADAVESAYAQMISEVHQLTQELAKELKSPSEPQHD
jgi:regulator of PEP synthase PpsR (kinase-PPPase family)